MNKSEDKDKALFKAISEYHGLDIDNNSMVYLMVTKNGKTYSLLHCDKAIKEVNKKDLEYVNAKIMQLLQYGTFPTYSAYSTEVKDVY